jgi:AcrR family transcriptional regulator
LPEPAGRRERKKQRTRAAIQREAMRLFGEQGFEATTVDQIAEAADIAPSTFFTYFPSKVAVVLEDDLDPPLLAAFNAQPAEVPPVAALRAAMREVFSTLSVEQDRALRLRMRLIAGDRELRAAMLEQFAALTREVAEVVAARTGAGPDDFELQTLAGALLGVMMATLFAAAADPERDVIQLLDAALAHLENGLRLPAPAAGLTPRARFRPPSPRRGAPPPGGRSAAR